MKNLLVKVHEIDTIKETLTCWNIVFLPFTTSRVDLDLATILNFNKMSLNKCLYPKWPMLHLEIIVLGMGSYFFNFLRASFMRTDPKKAKRVTT